jgi:formylglycine-generating enzyme required for sulfatase activity
VGEWCGDYYSPSTNDLAKEDPVRTDKASKDVRVVRGGSWDSAPMDCRSASRNFQEPDRHSRNIGFRVVFLP